MGTIIETLWEFLFNVIQQFVSDICLPIDTLLASAFEDVSITAFLQDFYSVLNDYVIPSISFFINLIPPKAWTLILFYYSFIAILYSIALVSHLIYFPLKFIKKYIPSA